MPQNDFLPFALGAGANVVPQSDWAADSDRITGFTRGIARSAKANTAWRQSSFVMAAIAEMMSRRGKDARDNGDLSAFINNYEGAIGEIVRAETGLTILTAPLDLYVATTGNDTNLGTLTAPFRTLQRAWDYVQQSVLDMGHRIRVNVAPGTYTQGLRCSNSPTTTYGLTFVGSPANPSQTIISVTHGACVLAENAAIVGLDGFTFADTGSSGPSDPGGGNALLSWDYATIYASNCQWNAMHGHVYAGWFGTCYVGGRCIIAGDGDSRYYMTNFGLIQVDGAQYQIVGNRNFGVWCAATTLSSFVWYGFQPITITGGTVTGKQYDVDRNAIIHNGQAFLFPGNVAGTSSRGGLYTGFGGLAADLPEGSLAMAMEAGPPKPNLIQP